MTTANNAIYLDYNATTRPSPKVVARVAQVSSIEYGNPSSSHCLGRRARQLLDKCRASIGKQLGIPNPHKQLVFTSGATESNNIALRGRIAHCSLKKHKPHVICTNMEHASVHVTLLDMQRHGLINLTMIPVDKDGLIRIDALRKAIRPDTVLVAIILANNEIGTIQDSQAIMKVCRNHPGLHVHLDVTQMVGRYPLDLNKLGADTASFSAHKFCGPRGVGGLFLKTPTSIDTIMTGGLQENDLRAGTENLAGIAGMEVALKESLHRIRDKIVSTEKKRDYLQKLFVDSFKGGVVINGLAHKAGHPSWCHRLYNTLSVSLPFCDSRTVIQELRDKGVCMSVGSACSKQGGSKVLQAIGLSEALQRGTFRISLGHDTTTRELQRAFQVIYNVLRKQAHQKRVAQGA